MRYRFILALCIACFCTITPVRAQVSISIGINVPVYPQLVLVPGYPVYYAPGLRANFFFYDGMYWVFADDNWYVSAWYNGPWEFVAPMYVPYYVLRVPVRYYRYPPSYFRGWRPQAPPRWGQHWGPQWEQQHRGWDQWNRRAAPAPAPLPSYQRRYSGERYPHAEQQRELQDRNYRHQPRSDVARQHHQRQAERRESAPARQWQQDAPQERHGRPQEAQRARPQEVPRPSGPQRSERAQREQQAPWVGQPQQQQSQPAPQQRGRGHEGPKDKDREKREKRDEREKERNG